MKRLLVGISIAIALIGCKARSSDALHGDDGQPSTADSSRVDTLEVMIESLKNQLETNQKISDAEREELEKQLKQAEEAKAKAQGTNPSPTPTPTASATPTTPKLEGPYAIYYMTDCISPLDPDNLGDGSIFKAYPCNSSSMQQFSLEMRDGGFFRMIHRMTNKCLIMSGNTAGEGTPPTLYPCKATADNAEQWRFFDAAADGSNFKVQNRLSSFCLKIGNDGTIFQGSCATNYTVFMLKKVTP